jgi:hypothetical protein
MHIASDMGTVRIVYDGSPFDVLYDIKVERLSTVNGNSMTATIACQMIMHLLLHVRLLHVR